MAFCFAFCLPFFGGVVEVRELLVFLVLEGFVLSAPVFFLRPRLEFFNALALDLLLIFAVA